MKITKIMKNYIVFAGIIVGLVATSFVITTPALAACDEDLGPTIATSLASNVTQESATLNAYFSSRDACYTSFDQPQVVFEFGETSNLDRQSNAIGVMLGATSVSVGIEDLEPSESYYYRAVMYYRNSIVKGDKVKFVTLGNTNNSNSSDIVVTESNTIVNSNSGGVITGSGSTTAVSGSTNTNTVTTNRPTGTTSTNTNGGSDSNGIAALSIDNNQDIMRDGEYVTYDVAYENLATDRELEDAVIMVTLPAGMQYVSGSDGVSYSNNRNAVIMNVRDVNPRESGSYTITARVRNIKLDQAIVEAKMTYRDVVTRSRESLEAYDIDEMDVSTYGAPLAAGLFASGFLPGSIFGWLLVAVLLIGIIYLVRAHFWRYYWHEDRPAHPARAHDSVIGQAPRRA